MALHQFSIVTVLVLIRFGTQCVQHFVEREPLLRSLQSGQASLRLVARQQSCRSVRRGHQSDFWLRLLQHN